MVKNLNLRTPKGTKDLAPKEAKLKEKIIEICKSVFKNHGGLPIETPSFELREILQGKYREDTKLIFNLEDQGGDVCSLRYDLTVPFSRFISISNISRLRKYQIGNVYRRDNPSHGRLREFTQADFDICGNSELKMVNDAEILNIADKICKDVNNKYDIGKHKIYVNSRKIIWAILEKLEIPKEFYDAICSSMDKVEKLSQEKITQEFLAKGLSNTQSDQLYAIITKKNNILNFIREFLGEQANDVIEEIMLLQKYAKILGTDIEINLGLVRGLSYYTGLIFEVVLENSSFGSIMGGGRYDNLCSSISNYSVPCVGFSVGISRLMAVVMENDNNLSILERDLSKNILIGTAYGPCIEERLSLLNELSSHFKVEIFPSIKSNFNRQCEYAKKMNYEFIIFTGENEAKDKIVKLYDVTANKTTQIKIDCLIESLKDYFNNKN